MADVKLAGQQVAPTRAAIVTAGWVVRHRVPAGVSQPAVKSTGDSPQGVFSRKDGGLDRRVSPACVRLCGGDAVVRQHRQLLREAPGGRGGCMPPPGCRPVVNVGHWLLASFEVVLEAW